MQYLEFINQMVRLEDTYAKKDYPKERVNAIWEAVKVIPLDDFKLVVTTLIGKMARAPMLTEFEDAAKAFIERQVFSQRMSVDRALSSLPLCRWCEQGGLVRAEQRGLESEAVFRCPYCPAAKMKDIALRIPLWSQDWNEQYWLKTHAGQLVDPFEDIQPSRVPDEVLPASNEGHARRIADKVKSVMGQKVVQQKFEQNEFDL